MDLVSVSHSPYLLPLISARVYSTIFAWFDWTYNTTWSILKKLYWLLMPPRVNHRHSLVVHDNSSSLREQAPDGRRGYKRAWKRSVANITEILSWGRKLISFPTGFLDWTQHHQHNIFPFHSISKPFWLIYLSSQLLLPQHSGPITIVSSHRFLDIHLGINFVQSCLYAAINPAKSSQMGPDNPYQFPTSPRTIKPNRRAIFLHCLKQQSNFHPHSHLQLACPLRVNPQ